MLYPPAHFASRASPGRGAPKGRDVDFHTITRRENLMQQATQDGYRKLAANFYATRMKGEQPSPKRLSDALKACAGEYRPAYWRRLRNAIAFDQRERGFDDAAKRIDGTINPLTKDGVSDDVKSKQPRAKRINETDEKKLFEHFTKLNDPVTTAALYVAKHTGARPAEFAGIQVIDGRVFVPGAKQSHGGTRGADRLLDLPPGVVNAIGHAVKYLKDDIGPTQDRIRSAAKKLWPQRKALPSLYSWRHQMGSDLKASGMSREEVAFVMGHQATASADVYGNSRTARGGRSLPKAPEGTDLGSVRDTIKQPPGAASAALANARPEGLRADLPPSPASLVQKLQANGLNSLRVSNEKFGERQGVSSESGLKR